MYVNKPQKYVYLGLLNSSGGTTISGFLRENLINLRGNNLSLMTS